jgi:1-acyl-sn-glycerol-3-phosphate acyltransferase
MEEAMPDPPATEETLCALVRDMARELAPRRGEPHITLESSLDRDLGFDSLGRMELLSRLERRFGVVLPDQLLTSAETVRDLLRAVNRGEAPLPSPSVPGPDLAMPGGGYAAHEARTLVEMLEIQARQAPGRIHIHLYPADDRREEISAAALLGGASEVGAGLQRLGVEPGQSVAIMLPTSRDYLDTFFGTLLAGAVPVPLYPPLRPAQIEDHLRRHRHILANAQARLLVTVPEARPLARILKAQLDDLAGVETVATLRGAASPLVKPPISPQDTAFLQYTSGSTGTPKGVILTHANLLANIRAMGRAVRAGPEDVFVSWLPLYHDMGLIGAWLGSLYHGCPLVLLSPMSFLRRPSRWLWAIHNHRGTLSAAPNFGYELCLSKIGDDELEGLDLTSWRVAFNGAEPVSPATLERFANRFARYGLRPEALAPVYGLAEASVGLAFPPPDRGPLIDCIDRHALQRSGIAQPVPPGDPAALRVVACGQPLAGHLIRIVDDLDRELPERHEGHLQFRGPSVTSGYFRSPVQTGDLFHGQWLDSGDLAYQAGGDVFLTGRVKDIIIRGGRNICPYELEEAIGGIEGVRKGCVAVFGVEGETTERLVILAESRLRDPGELERLRERINDLSVDILGTPPEEVVLAPPHSVPKTSSGKIRRAASRELYEQGRLDRPSRAVWWQLTRLTLASFAPLLRRRRRQLMATLYAGWCWAVFGLLGALAWILAAVLPGRRARWAAMRAAARLLVRLSGTSLHVRGLENIAGSTPLILAGNHQSYLDAIVLTAVLPREVIFVAKAELADRFAARVLLSRLGVEFVERFDGSRAVADARRLGDLAAGGRSIFFFPEGTLQSMPGLLPFRMGAFLAAAENGLGVLPVTIRGTRSKLRGGTWFPRRGPVSVTLGPPRRSEGSGALRDDVRREILARCGEPDRDTGDTGPQNTTRHA